VSFDKLSGGSIDLTGAVTITGEKLTTILDEFGIDVRFLTWYPNKIKNSSFEIYDSVTKIPKHWTGTGTSTTTSAWDETCSCKLTPGQYIIQEVAAGANPQWWNTISKASRVSFHKKGGAVTISVLDSSNADAPFEIYKQEGNHGTTLEYPYNADWIPAAYSINFVHGSCTKMLVRFENTDATYDAYVDGIIGEPDYTRKRPSMYRHGPDSVSNINGESIYYSPTITVKNIDYSVTNAAEVEVTDTETTILTKTFTLDVSSDAKILFSCNGTSSDALAITFYSYQDSTARTYKPVGTMFGINSEIHTYVDTITDLAIGDYTITIKGKTSNGTYTIPIGFATLDILLIPLMTMLQTLDCTGLTLTVIDDDEIDAVWVNPTETGFSSVELYRSETDLTSQTRDWCVANADLAYSGALELYNNTGLDADTLYYYKLFAVYVDSRTHYSDGITESATTEAAGWENYPPTPTLNYPDRTYQAIIKRLNQNVTKLICSDTSMGLWDCSGTFGDFRMFNLNGLWNDLSVYVYDGLNVEWDFETDTAGLEYLDDDPWIVYENNFDIYEIIDTGGGVYAFNANLLQAQTTP
jgi:hypothetical protein